MGVGVVNEMDLFACQPQYLIVLVSSGGLCPGVVRVVYSAGGHD